MHTAFLKWQIPGLPGIKDGGEREVDGTVKEQDEGALWGNGVVCNSISAGYSSLFMALNDTELYTHPAPSQMPGFDTVILWDVINEEN